MRFYTIVPLAVIVSVAVGQGNKPVKELRENGIASAAYIQDDFGTNLSAGKTTARQLSAKIRPVSAMIDPMAFPSARPGSPDHAAMTETAHSGLVVPSDTTVAPTMIFEIPSR